MHCAIAVQTLKNEIERNADVIGNMMRAINSKNAVAAVPEDLEKIRAMIEAIDGMAGVFERTKLIVSSFIGLKWLRLKRHSPMWVASFTKMGNSRLIIIALCP